MAQRCAGMSKEPVQPPQPPAEEPGKPYPVENPPPAEPNEDRPLVDPVPPNTDLPRMETPRGSMKSDQTSQPDGAPDQQPEAVRAA